MHHHSLPGRRRPQKDAPSGHTWLRRGLGLTAVTGLLTIGLAVPSASAAAPAGYVPMSALINGDSVTTSDNITDSSGNAISLEQYAAQHAGYTVHVATGAEWAAMTAADFAKYQVLIIGDPFCSAVPDSATANSTVWAPVVMGTSGQNTTVGNRALVGTDPEYHYLEGGGGAAPTDPSDPSTAGTEHLVEAGITYAGGVGGATGVYFDTTCGDNGSEVAVLNSLSSTGTGFTTDDAPPCGGSVQLIASNPVFSKVTDADIQGWQCSDHTTYPTYPTDWQPLAVATDTTAKPTCGTDPTDNSTACGESYVLVAGKGIVVTAPDLALTPTSDSAPAGGQHTVTATVKTSGSPQSGVTVTFAVTGQNAGVTGTCVPVSCVTDANGTVTFTYTDVNGAGDDTINASITVSGTTEHATAGMTWTKVNHAPTADPKTVTTPQNTAVGITLSGSDPDGDSLTYTVATAPTHGTLSGTAPNLTYTPSAGYTGTDSFTYTVNDGTTNSAPATVSITVTPVSTGCTTKSPTVDKSVSADVKAASSTFKAPALTTSGGGELIVVFVEADGPAAPTQTVTKVTATGLTFTLAARSNATWGTTEVWQAYASATLTSAVVSASLASAYDGSITVVAFSGAGTKLGSVGTGSGTTGTPSAAVKPAGCNSLVWAAGHDWSKSTTPVAAAGQTFAHTFVDTRVHDSFWVQQVTAPTKTGTTVTVSDTAPTKDRWTLAAVEVRGS